MSSFYFKVKSLQFIWISLNESCRDMVIFLQTTHKRHSIARPHRQTIKCSLWVHSLNCPAHHLWYHIIIDCVIKGSTDAECSLSYVILPCAVLASRTYPALETLTEPHRLISCLNCVVGVARSMVGSHRWYPEGRTHVLPLLNLCLPGIDPNDIKKCLVRRNIAIKSLFQYEVFLCMWIPILK